MGRYPFVCAYRRYLKNARARLGEGTIAERECKLHYLSKVVQQLNDAGKMSSPNPTLFTEEDIIEIFMALKQRGMKCSTLTPLSKASICHLCTTLSASSILLDASAALRSASIL